MHPMTHVSIAERAGRAFGRASHAAERAEARVVDGLMRCGFSRVIAKAALWIAKLVFIGVLLYVAFWLAFLAAFAMAAAWVARNADWEEDKQPEWRNGLLGFGLYHPDGSRIDPHDPDDEV
jgi:hypothetical protein